MRSTTPEYFRHRILGAPLLMLALTACGGGSAAFDNAVGLADAKETSARALGVDTPCASTTECSVLEFGATSRACGSERFKVYSLLSPTARQAEQVAAEQRALAAQALALAPGNGGNFCPQGIMGPTPTCVSARCTG